MSSDTPTPRDPMHRLAAALADSLKAIESDYSEEVRGIREKLAEARQEAEKVEPNSVKLKAILADCNDMVRTFAALDPAWQGVQRVARLIGIL
jgi:hypothetical protein